ncbi:hypothetical protein COCON_G00124950 [Conger conger]|uniref:Raftlin n=1 Tax=Conger conger TaxID=82655 RepID=A0A9Q1HUW4_CONCO|nr:hypothetical protein COCON_G00124950 [Conger conger]
MTQHFRSGASLVDGYFHLGTQPSGGVLPETVEGVFVFQEGAESDYPAASAFDAIVVEQCTVIHGVQVKTDYVPLLQSLALYGWRLTCVLPTPIANGNSDGSVCTKQILFLQRPVLQRKRENRKLSLSLRGKNRAVKKATPTAPAAAPPTAPPKGPETERWGQQGPIEGPEREERAEREEREEGGRVGRMNDKNRLNETEEREAELGAEPGSAALQSGGNPENCWAGLMDESAVGGVSGQLGGAEDGPTASTNQRLGMVDGGGVREASDSDCILVT